MDYDSLRQPLWVQIPLADYEAALWAGELVAEQRHEIYHYTAASGPSGRTHTKMVELHVDESDSFDAVRAASAYGGTWSVRWADRPTSPPTQPPADLPNPAEDTLGAADAAAAAEAAALAAGGAAPPPSDVPDLTVGQVSSLKVGELRAALNARSLEATGLKADLAARLKAHLTPSTGEEPDDSQEYDVLAIHDFRIVDGVLEYLVEWKGWEGEQTWEPEHHLDGCNDELHTFYSDPKHAQLGCRYGHRKGFCKCHLPLYQIGQDETVFKEFAYSVKQWIIRGLRGVRKKSDGRGKHLSGVQDEIRGAGFPMTAEELATANAFRATRGRKPLDCSPGMRFLDFGKNKDGYWDYDKFLEQVVDLIDAFEAVHPDWQMMLEIDWSSGHAKHREGSLNTNSMNVCYGGSQKIPRDSAIPEKVNTAIPLDMPHTCHH